MTCEHSRATIVLRPLAFLALLVGEMIAPNSVVAQPVMPGTAADRDEVRRAVLDYVEGFYEGDSAKLARSIRPEVYKYGFWKARDSTRYAGEQMTWPEFFSYARGVKQNNRQAPATAPKRIELFEVQSQTAAAKVTAFWGTDYLLLGKYNGKWMISSVMWQGPLPRPAPSGGGGGGGEENDSAVEPFNNDLFATDNVFRGTFAPDGRTFFFFRKVAQNPRDEDYRIFESRLVDGRWSQPTRVALGGEFSDLYPTITPDGRRMIFASYRPAPGDTSSHRNAHLWYADRQGDGWATPVFMAKPSFLGYYNRGPIALADGSVFFASTTPDWRTSRTYLTRWNGREYSAAEPYQLADRWTNWRSDVAIWGAVPSPDGSFALIEVSELNAEQKRLPADLYVSFKRGTEWSEPQPLRGGVNSGATENFAMVSPDMKQLVFVRDFSGFYRADLAKVLPH